MIYALLWKSVSGFIFHHQAHSHGGEEARWHGHNAFFLHIWLSSFRGSFLASLNCIPVFYFWPRDIYGKCCVSSSGQPASMSYSRGTFKHPQELLSRPESFIVRDRNKNDIPLFDEWVAGEDWIPIKKGTGWNGIIIVRLIWYPQVTPIRDCDLCYISCLQQGQSM